jgi:hypothetical protein
MVAVVVKPVVLPRSAKNQTPRVTSEAIYIAARYFVYKLNRVCWRVVVVAGSQPFRPLRHCNAMAFPPDARTAKVPEITALFWILKIAATTLGETAGDSVTMSLDWGYLAGSALFAALFAICVAGQVRAARFRPWLYWLAIVATTTVGTTLADFADRSLGIAARLHDASAASINCDKPTRLLVGSEDNS